MIPLTIEPAAQWHISDAFGTFGQTSADPLIGLFQILAQVETAWEERHGEVLPARWLRALSLRLPCPVHMALFEGRSLQLPLLLAVLRGLSAAANPDGVIPFGTGPVFATGTVEADGSFGPVANVGDKLAGFIRELGPGHPALLTTVQQQELQGSSPNLLEQVEGVIVNNLAELLDCESLRHGLQQLCTAYEPAWNEELLSLANSLKRRIEFEDMRRLGNWMLSHLQSPYYRFRFGCDLALYYFHRGQFSEANRHFQQAQQWLRDNPTLFGADDEGYLLTVMGDLAADARHTGFYAFIVEQAALPIVGYMDGPQRVRLYGVLCQLHRFFGHPQEAIAAGRQAMALVSQVLVSDAGRTCNYLIHALVAAYREAAPQDPALLAEARTQLAASRSDWLPRHDAKARDSHLTFCQHLEAEIARLSGQPYAPPDAPGWRGFWGQAWLFTLLSCARNPRNPDSDRKGYLTRLLEEAAEYESREGSASLFGLFGSVYLLYAAVVREEDASGPRRAFDAWLDNQATAGFPGWRDYLAPLLPPVIDRAAVEALCDAIRYH